MLLSEPVFQTDHTRTYMWEILDAWNWVGVIPLEIFGFYYSRSMTAGYQIEPVYNNKELLINTDNAPFSREVMGDIVVYEGIENLSYSKYNGIQRRVWTSGTIEEFSFMNGKRQGLERKFTKNFMQISFWDDGERIAQMYFTHKCRRLWKHDPEDIFTKDDNIPLWLGSICL